MVLNKVLGIVGSPRKGKLTDQLVSRCLDGIVSAGIKTEKAYLIDYKIPIYTEQAEDVEELNRLCEEADAIIIGAPVYWGGINGLTKDFMDNVRISNANGKYGIGISIAGGTGRGLCSALQNIYRFFYHRRMRGLDPTPVSRFNFADALKSLYVSGQKLANFPIEKKLFEGDKDRIEYYERLDYLDYTYSDEMILLADYLVKISEGKPNFLVANKEYEYARYLCDQGKKEEAVKHAIEAYTILYFDPP